ncbi:nucleotide 5'-monophosphate nucleosidase PpnN [Sedimenticola hydrogenitrophicus]|uniref:nucleotide 5'-monophosphate nucleosidase PpnN n=1 Tax=Sedimenticola hydrogenitrophicus TaxID=2967975 RepID=UPI0023B068CC|nr:nucleotide 5'-monophosphate nucleosidase PpnN [Sedimenticola hydrogenitrophicus]
MLKKRVINKVVNSTIRPASHMAVLSRREIEQLRDVTGTGLHRLFRKCALAVLSSGSQVDNCEELMSMYPDFDIQVRERHQGIVLEVSNAPAEAFVDDQLIEGIRYHLFSVLRDILYLRDTASNHKHLAPNMQISHEIFYRLRHAGAFHPGKKPNTVVCWGGHAIPVEEYDYTKEIGYYLGLRGIDICTGCGAGAMKGPMKGAAIAHAKQRHTKGRHIGLTEPGIIAAEAPNAIVNELIVMPDIEKRLEAFIRLGHVLIIFPGGVGTMEELLFVLGVLSHPDNLDIELPIFLTGPESSSGYFDSVIRFIEMTLGSTALNLVRKVIGNPGLVAKLVNDALLHVTKERRQRDDSFHYNWSLHIEQEFQEPFVPDHESMAKLQLSRDLPTQELAANLRRALSGIVTGNVKEPGINAIRERGPFQITGEPELMNAMDELLTSFTRQGRMKVKGDYLPCYEIVKSAEAATLTRARAIEPETTH